MRDNVPAEQAVTRIEHPLPARVQEALGELVGVAQKGLLALSVGVGLGVLAELVAADRHRPAVCDLEPGEARRLPGCRGGGDRHQP